MTTNNAKALGHWIIYWKRKGEPDVRRKFDDYALKQKENAERFAEKYPEAKLKDENREMGIDRDDVWDYVETLKNLSYEEAYQRIENKWKGN